MKDIAVLVPPTGESGTWAAPLDVLSTRLRIRNLEPRWTDLGIFAWRELRAISAESPSEDNAQHLRRWLIDSLEGERTACVVPISSTFRQEACRAAVGLAQLVKHVVIAPLDSQPFKSTCLRCLDASDSLDGVVSPQGYVPLGGGMVAPWSAFGQGLPKNAETALLSPCEVTSSWSSVRDLVSALVDHPDPWTCPAPPSYPDDEGILDLLVESRCAEIRIPVRSFSPLSRSRLNECSLDEMLALLHAAKERRLRISIALEVGFAWETQALFKASLSRLRSISHLVSRLHDLHAHLPEQGAPATWHDGGSNNLSYRLTRARELAGLLRGLRVDVPWFFTNERPIGGVEDNVVFQRLIGQV